VCAYWLISSEGFSADAGEDPSSTVIVLIARSRANRTAATMSARTDSMRRLSSISPGAYDAGTDRSGVVTGIRGGAGTDR
jgi:hypothetical protein